jgi:Ca2+-transporting ATPase
LREYPFSAERRSAGMAWHAAKGGTRVVLKGAPEAIAAACRLPDVQRHAIEARVDDMARRGLRILGVAQAHFDAVPDDPAQAALHWCGLVAFADPLRAGVPAAVAQARAAGIRVVMLTGDHAQTARTIASQAGLAPTDVFARVRPEHKLQLVETLQRDGEVVAMTGDGINDAPALAAAHVGVAMGHRGTDVAREAASIVLVDDDFTTLVHAVAEGRRIYDNMRRAVLYILAVHVPITLLALLPVMFGVPPVLVPIHVVLLQLIIDPTCAIVFESEPASRDIMDRPPRPPTQSLVSASKLVATLLQGAVMFVPVLTADLVARHWGWPPAQVAALDFTALVAGNLALILLYRPGDTLVGAAMGRNGAFTIVAIATLAMLVPTTRVASTAAWIGLTPPPVAPWIAALVAPFLLAAVLKRVGARLTSINIDGDTPRSNRSSPERSPP